jgi:hypothetical protein
VLAEEVSTIAHSNTINTKWRKDLMFGEDRHMA